MFDPFLSPRNSTCSGLSKLCFPLREIFSVTQNSLPARGRKAPPKSSLFTGHPVCRDTLRAKFNVMEQKKSPQKRGKGGRPPKTDPAKNCLMVRFTDEEYARFLTMFEQSGVLSKAQFIKARVFDATFRVIQKDLGTMEIAARLTTFLAQFRKIGVNYNQVVKELNTHFSQKKALALLYKLENGTRDLITVSEKILALTEEFRQRW